MLIFVALEFNFVNCFICYVQILCGRFFYVFFVGLRVKHRTEVENLTLTKQPVETLKLFILAIVQYLKHSLVYLLTKGVWLLILCVLVLVFGFYISSVDSPHHEVGSANPEN